MAVGGVEGRSCVPRRRREDDEVRGGGVDNVGVPGLGLRVHGVILGVGRSQLGPGLGVVVLVTVVVEGGGGAGRGGEEALVRPARAALPGGLRVPVLVVAGAGAEQRQGRAGAGPGGQHRRLARPRLAAAVGQLPLATLLVAAGRGFEGGRGVLASSALATAPAPAGAPGVACPHHYYSHSLTGHIRHVNTY